jgi:hypothetical protein
MLKSNMLKIVWPWIGWDFRLLGLNNGCPPLAFFETQALAARFDRYG